MREKARTPVITLLISQLIFVVKKQYMEDQPEQFVGHRGIPHSVSKTMFTQRVRDHVPGHELAASEIQKRSSTENLIFN